jgi:hypothetical protein
MDACCCDPNSADHKPDDAKDYRGLDEVEAALRALCMFANLLQS